MGNRKKKTVSNKSDLSDFDKTIAKLAALRLAGKSVVS